MTKRREEGRRWVRKQYRYRGENVGDAEEEEEMILVDDFDVEPSHAEGKVGLTINLGDFESLRIDVGARIPCYKEELPEAYEEVFELVETQLFRKVHEIRENV